MSTAVNQTTIFNIKAHSIYAYGYLILLLFFLAMALIFSALPFLAVISIFVLSVLYCMVSIKPFFSGFLLQYQAYSKTWQLFQKTAQLQHYRSFFYGKIIYLCFTVENSQRKNKRQHLWIWPDQLDQKSRSNLLYFLMMQK